MVVAVVVATAAPVEIGVAQQAVQVVLALQAL
jgi:hypothetical protein